MKEALNKENEERIQENVALENRMGSTIVSERKKIEEELNIMTEDIKSMKTGSGGALSSAASTA